MYCPLEMLSAFLLAIGMLCIYLTLNLVFPVLIRRGAILIRWGAIHIRWGAILIRRGARCSSMLWTLCEVSSFPRVCLCWQLLASVLLASVLLPINLILLCIYLTLNLVFPVLIRRGAIHIHRGAILIRRGAIGAQ